MSAKRPTDKQLVAWYIYTSIGMNEPILTNAYTLQEEIHIAFEMKLSINRCYRLRNLLMIEVDKLKGQYVETVSQIASI